MPHSEAPWEHFSPYLLELRDGYRPWFGEKWPRGARKACAKVPRCSAALSGASTRTRMALASVYGSEAVESRLKAGVFLQSKRLSEAFKRRSMLFEALQVSSTKLSTWGDVAILGAARGRLASRGESGLLDGWLQL